MRYGANGVPLTEKKPENVKKEESLTTVEYPTNLQQQNEENGTAVIDNVEESDVSANNE